MKRKASLTVVKMEKMEKTEAMRMEMTRVIKLRAYQGMAVGMEIVTQAPIEVLL